MTTLGWIITAGTVWFCFQFLAVIIGWRLAPMRGRAVVEWQDCDKQERTEWDDHVDDAMLLTHEAIPDADEIGAPVMWMALETQCADLNELAEQLGERAT